MAADQHPTPSCISVVVAVSNSDRIFTTCLPGTSPWGISLQGVAQLSRMDCLDSFLFHVLVASDQLHAASLAAIPSYRSILALKPPSMNILYKQYLAKDQCPAKLTHWLLFKLSSCLPSPKCPSWPLRHFSLPLFSQVHQSPAPTPQQTSRVPALPPTHVASTSPVDSSSKCNFGTQIHRRAPIRLGPFTVSGLTTVTASHYISLTIKSIFRILASPLRPKTP